MLNVGQRQKKKKVSLYLLFLALPSPVVELFSVPNFFFFFFSTETARYKVWFVPFSSCDFKTLENSKIWCCIPDLKAGLVVQRIVIQNNEDNLCTGWEHWSIIKTNSPTWSPLPSIVLQLTFWQRLSYSTESEIHCTLPLSRCSILAQRLLLNRECWTNHKLPYEIPTLSRWQKQAAA